MDNENMENSVFNEGKIIDVDVNDEMKSSFLDYSMSVIISRALPDVRDGLKPVHRRILYTMYEKGLDPNKPYHKCADTVGAVLGAYHPHGDASVYDALVRLAQDFSMRYMLVDGHGNFGSVDGDPPAAYRYTEARMSKISCEMLTDIDKKTVDFQPNFDDRLEEPTVLPSRFPNLLVNGSDGIAVGMATKIPPHNLGETIDAACALIENPDIDLAGLMEYMPGPDFPTGGIIMGRSGIRATYATGRGKIIVRAKTEIVEAKNGRYKIIVTELPYQVNKARLIEYIADLVKDKRIEGISNIEDHSDILDSWLADDTTKDMVSMDRPNTNYTYFYMFNFCPLPHNFSNATVDGLDAEYEPENWAKAINSTNFRKAFLYGINNAVTLAVQAPEGYENYKLNTITPPSFCANSEGVDYLQCGDLANITEFFDEAKAKEYRDAAVEELTAAGATFPIKVQLPYNPSSVDWDKQCQVLKQQLESVLNDGFNFIDIIITAGPSDGFLSTVRRNGKFCFLLCNWGADYSDPQTESDPFYQAKGDRGSRYAFLRTGVEDGYITGETADAVLNYMNAIEEATAITEDIDARYDAFANAEASLINNALVVPMGMSVPKYLATRLNYWEGQYASTGFSNKRLKGIHVLDHYVSMAEYEANRDAR